MYGLSVDEPASARVRATPLVPVVRRTLNPSSISHPASLRTSRAVASPTVSVVIPAHGRIAKLQRCLDALADQTLPRDAFEVIVCDDGSPEPIAPALEGFRE